MPTDVQTGNRGYPLPHADNLLDYDIARLITALNAIDVDMATALVVAGVYAQINSPAFTGVPTAPTAALGDNTTQLSTTAFVQAAINALIDASPGALDTLNELAAALGDDANFAATMTTALAGKSSTSHNHNAAYAAISHGHAQTEITDLVSDLGAKAPSSRSIATGTGLSGGGDLSANRTLSADIASQAEAEGGTNTSKLMNPLRTKQAIDIFGGASNRAYDEYTTWTTLSSNIPQDDTIPQSSEGTEILSVTFTPSSTTARLRVMVYGTGTTSSSGQSVVASVFDGAANAKLVFFCRNLNNGTYETSMAGVGEYVPGVNTPITISVRVGSQSGSFYPNGSSGGRLYGGKNFWALVVEEI